MLTSATNVERFARRGAKHQRANEGEAKGCCDEPSDRDGVDPVAGNHDRPEGMQRIKARQDNPQRDEAGSDKGADDEELAGG